MTRTPHPAKLYRIMDDKLSPEMLYTSEAEAREMLAECYPDAGEVTVTEYRKIGRRTYRSADGDTIRAILTRDGWFEMRPLKPASVRGVTVA